MDEGVLDRRVLRLSVQLHRRGFMMLMWQLEEIVKRRLVRELFRRLREERRGAS